jgi:phage terminase large subunit GpA-like protein
MQDEVDASKDDKEEGDVLALADRAAETFSNPFLLKSSTPTIAGFSRIDAGYESSDKKLYFVPCPCCGHMQPLEPEYIKFSFTEEEHKNLLDGNPNKYEWTIGAYKIIDVKNAIYVCLQCKHGWTDTQRITSIMSGHTDNPPVIVPGIGPVRAEWRGTAPFNGINGRRLPGVYALIGLKQGYNSYLHMFADKFLKAVHGGRAKLMAWTNMFAARTFEDQSESVEWKELKNLAEDYGPSPTIPHIPDQVMLTLATVDNQADRVEITCYGFGDEQQAWILDYKVIWGDMDTPAMRGRVSDYLVNKRFTHRYLDEMALEMVLFDSAFQKNPKVKAVYRFCKEHAARQFFAIRGVRDMGGTIYSSRIEHAFGVRIFNLNSDVLKDIAMSYLQNRIKAGKDISAPNSLHFPNRPEFNEKFFVGLCSEKCFVSKLPNGMHKRVWKKVTSSVRNEPWDLLYYALGGFEILRHAGKVEWIARKWLEVKKKMELADPTPKSTLHIPQEAQVKEMVKTPPARPQQRSPWRKSGGTNRGGGGFWNPLGV